MTRKRTPLEKLQKREKEQEDFRRAVADLRANWWMMVGDTAFRFARKDGSGFAGWFSRGAYRKAAEAKGDAQ